MNSSVEMVIVGVVCSGLFPLYLFRLIRPGNGGAYQQCVTDRSDHTDNG